MYHFDGKMLTWGIVYKLRQGNVCSFLWIFLWILNCFRKDKFLKTAFGWIIKLFATNQNYKEKNKTQDVFIKVVNEFQSNDKQKYELDGKGKLMTRKEVWGEKIVMSIKCSTLWIQHFTIKFASFADVCDRT